MSKPLTTDELRNDIAIILWPRRSNPGYTFLTDEEKKLVDPIMAAVRDHVDFIIGEDVSLEKRSDDDPGFDWENHWKNELRAEQRNTAGPY